MFDVVVLKHNTWTHELTFIGVLIDALSLLQNYKGQIFTFIFCLPRRFAKYRWTNERTNEWTNEWMCVPVPQHNTHLMSRSVYLHKGKSGQWNSGTSPGVMSTMGAGRQLVQKCWSADNQRLKSSGVTAAQQRVDWLVCQSWTGGSVSDRGCDQTCVHAAGDEVEMRVCRHLTIVTLASSSKGRSLKLWILCLWKEVMGCIHSSHCLDGCGAVAESEPQSGQEPRGPQRTQGPQVSILRAHTRTISLYK